MTPTAPAPSKPAPPRSRATARRTSLFAHGEPMVWLTGGALAVSLFMVVGLLALVLMQGLLTFWPVPLERVTTLDGKVYLGEHTRTETYRPPEAEIGMIPAGDREEARAKLAASGGKATRRLYRTGNFDLTNTHFHWISDLAVKEVTTPRWAVILERLAWGRFYGFPVAFILDGARIAESPEEAWALFRRHHDEVRARWQARRNLEKGALGRVSAGMEAARLELRGVELDHGRESPEYRRAGQEFRETERKCQEQANEIKVRIRKLDEENDRYKLVLRTVSGTEKAVPLADIVRGYPANQLGFWDKLGVYLDRWGEYLSDDPREANSEGGVFPAIFGTVVMTLIMVILVVPFGVLAALYLREYAKAGFVVSTVRIAINNLAGVPSIVFGVFGVGFFCYIIGGWIDGGPEKPAAPGTWGFWAAGLAFLAVVGVLLTVLRMRRRERTGEAGRLLKLAVPGVWAGAFLLLVAILALNPHFHGFFRTKLPNPTYGKPGLLWASFTLALLTLPVVIVATEEALAAVPGSMREGSYACGASKGQTIRRIILPRALPGILTGTILAMARGAGEVAPLMLVGAVKLAPKLPIDGVAPYIHPERSFMHLGFHIYDLGFQSQNSEAAKPMVFTTTLLLIAIVVLLNVTAIWIRGRLHRRFVTGQF